MGAFAAAWVIAFATLPTFRVGFVLAAWLAWIVPQIVGLERRFGARKPG